MPRRHAPHAVPLPRPTRHPRLQARFRATGPPNRPRRIPRAVRLMPGELRHLYPLRTPEAPVESIIDEPNQALRPRTTVLTH